MSPALLEVDKVTVRFGGLTAVSEVTLQVQPGQVFAIIGPNGAGKTTLFNAITGVYAPTTGAVRFDGSDLQHPLTRGAVVRWVLTGLFVGLMLLLFSANIDRLWSVVVKDNYKSAAEGFPIGKALGDVWSYLTAQPLLVPRSTGGWDVVAPGLGRYAVATDEAMAAEVLAMIPRLEALDGDSTHITELGGHIAIVDDRREEITSAPDREKALELVQRTGELGRQRKSLQLERLVALLVGNVLGIAGAFAVWRQTRRTPSTVAARGIGRTFQNIRLFQEMTVLENVLVGMDRHLVHREPWYSRRRVFDVAAPAALLVLLLAVALSARLQAPAGLTTLLLALVAIGLVAYLARIAVLGAFSAQELVLEAAARTEGLGLLEFVGLAPRAGELARNLAYGNQRRLEIARAMATRPRLLLLDEPAAGMNPTEAVALMKLIADIRARGITVLLIEHHMRVVMGVSDRVAVLEYGRKIAEGTPDEVRADPKVVAAYLGKEELG